MSEKRQSSISCRTRVQKFKFYHVKHYRVLYSQPDREDNWSATISSGQSLVGGRQTGSGKSGRPGGDLCRPVFNRGERFIHDLGQGENCKKGEKPERETQYNYIDLREAVWAEFPNRSELRFQTCRVHPLSQVFSCGIFSGLYKVRRDREYCKYPAKV